MKTRLPQPYFLVHWYGVGFKYIGYVRATTRAPSVRPAEAKQVKDGPVIVHGVDYQGQKATSGRERLLPLARHGAFRSKNDGREGRGESSHLHVDLCRLFAS